MCSIILDTLLPHPTALTAIDGPVQSLTEMPENAAKRRKVVILNTAAVTFIETSDAAPETFLLLF